MLHWRTERLAEESWEGGGGAALKSALPHLSKENHQNPIHSLIISFPSPKVNSPLLLKPSIPVQKTVQQQESRDEQMTTMTMLMLMLMMGQTLVQPVSCVSKPIILFQSPNVSSHPLNWHLIRCFHPCSDPPVFS